METKMLDGPRSGGIGGAARFPSPSPVAAGHVRAKVCFLLGIGLEALFLFVLLFALCAASAPPARAEPAQRPPAAAARQFSRPQQVAAQCTPKVVITLLPAYGSFEDLRGTVECADPAAHRIAAYIYVSGWWTKPTFASPTAGIAADGSWVVDITTGGADQLATRVAVFLVAAGYTPPAMSGGPVLPAAIYDNAAAYLLAERAPKYRTLDFAGYRWRVKASSTPAGPGPNYFSDAEQDVRVDGSGHLHLALAYRNGRWYGTEVVNMLSLGQGVYTYTLRGPVDQLDVHAVFGLFTWDDVAPEANYREIDVEFSRWGDPAAPNAQYVVQPYQTAGNRHRFSLTLPGPRSRHVVHWRADGIDFRTEVEDPGSPGVWNSVHAWTYTGASNPAPGLENPRINFWLLDGRAPVNGLPAEVVVEDFEFAADGPPTAVLDVYRSGGGDGGVTAEPGGIDCGLDCAEDYALGTTVTLTATPQIGAAFLGWQGACTGAGACAVTLTENKVVTATFMPLVRLLVTRSGSGAGAVASTDGAVQCGTTCSAYYAQGAVVTLTATAELTSVFAAWSGACANAGPCVLAMAGDRSVDARFNVRTYNLAAAKAGAGGGVLTSQPGGIACGADCAEAYAYGTVVTVTAAPASGSVFGGWTGDCVGSGACMLVMEQSKFVTATFHGQGFPLTINTRGGARITSSPEGIDCGRICSAVFPEGTAVTLVNVTGAQYGMPPALVTVREALTESLAPLGDCLAPGACQVALTSSITVEVLPPVQYLSWLQK